MLKFKMYLLDENGNSPCFGVDEVLEAENHQEAVNDYRNHLCTYEGFKPGGENCIYHDDKAYFIQCEKVVLY